MTPRLNGYLILAPPILLLSGFPLYWAGAPYGWWHVLLVYLLATLPLAMLLAERVAAGVSPRLLAVVGAVSGVALCIMTVFVGKHLVAWLDQQQADLFARQSTLGMWCLLLQLPWCMVGQWVVGRFIRRDVLPTPALSHVALALIVAAILPAAWIERTSEKESKRAEELLESGQVLKAIDVVGNLRHMGSSKWLAGKSPAEMVFPLPPLIEYIDRPSSESRFTDAERMGQASGLAKWGRYDAATVMLLPLTGRDPAAALLLASINKEQEKWKECDQYCRLALALLHKLPRTDKELPGWVQAYDNLAFVAREQKRYDDARKVYEEAMRRVPPAQAYFHFQLGRLHRDAGRPFKALHHLQEAVKLDPESFEAKAGALMKDIRQHTPGCLLRWFGP